MTIMQILADIAQELAERGTYCNNVVTAYKQKGTPEAIRLSAAWTGTTYALLEVADALRRIAASLPDDAK